MAEEIRKCKYCGSEIKVNVGVHNWKNLFKKPNLDDWITLFIILMVLFSAYAYTSDINDMREYCNSLQNITIQNYPSDWDNLITNLTYFNSTSQLNVSKSILYLNKDRNGSN